MHRPDYGLDSASRLDVQRHRLQDQRAAYAMMNAKVKVERESRVLTWLRSVASEVASRWASRRAVEMLERELRAESAAGAGPGSTLGLEQATTSNRQHSG